MMIFNRVTTQPNQLNVSGFELWCQFGNFSKLSCADWSEILRMTKENSPFVVKKLMKVDPSFSTFCVKVRNCRTDSKISSCHCLKEHNNTSRYGIFSGGPERIQLVKKFKNYLTRNITT
eukprot:NODE_4_length_77007_cov_1.156642.p69 type:complete len:119 gc:universal NODE_4_length_77007_cov_1.156642:20836-20480(-)